MTQATEVAIATDAAIAGLGLLVLIGLGKVVGRMLRHATAPRGPHTHLPGVLVMGYRYCPTEQRTRAAVIRADRTAQCLDCGTHIPAPEVTP
jgi:hypothetical protein